MKRCSNRWAAVVAAGALLLAGCAGRQKNDIDISPAQAAQAIAEGVEFTDTLILAEGDVANGYYLLDDTVTDYAVYISGSGATAQEVAVLKVADAADAGHAEEIVRDRLERLKTMFENYRPDEMAKLQSAVVEVRGNVVYFVCSDDSAKAVEIIDSLYK